MAERLTPRTPALEVRGSCIARLSSSRFKWVPTTYYLTIRPVARKGYGSIAHEAKPNGLLTRGP